MNPKRFLILFSLISLLLFGWWLPANAAPNMQQTDPTATPGPDGRILYIVKAGDNCFRVAALHTITVEQLRILNKTLDENCTLTEGQELLIGIEWALSRAYPEAFAPAAAIDSETGIFDGNELRSK